jgi:hypothetical protein
MHGNKARASCPAIKKTLRHIFLYSQPVSRKKIENKFPLDSSVWANVIIIMLLTLRRTQKKYQYHLAAGSKSFFLSDHRW